MNLSTAVNERLDAFNNSAKRAYLDMVPGIGLDFVYKVYPVKGRPGFAREIGERVLDADGHTMPTAYNPATGKADPTGSRRSHNDRTQHEMCYRHCLKLAGIRSGVKGNGNHSEPEPVSPEPEPTQVSPEPATIEPEPTPEPVSPTIEPEPEPEPVRPTIVVATNGDAERYLQAIWRARDLVRESNRASVKGGTLPEPGTRAILDAAKAFKISGIPFDASLASVAIDWTDEISRTVGVREFDWTSLPMPEPTMPEPIEIPKLDVGWHKMAPGIIRAIQARNNVALIGPAGCGKTHIVGQIAAYLGLDYADLTMSGGATRGDLCGTETMSGFKPRSFPGIYADGGIFLADEMDRANPKLLPILNPALANGHWTNPMTGERLAKSPNFVFVACMNTLAMGADRRFVAAERLDEATLDRVRASRFQLDFDRDLERRLFEAILAI